MKCPATGQENCEVCEEAENNYNPCLLYNEKIVDFIRWGELIWNGTLSCLC
jgi:hypothetical protein